MIKKISLRQFLYFAGQISNLYGLFVLLSVVFNSRWALTRAAGGQFTTFPTWLRVSYLFMTIGVVVLFFFLRSLSRGPISSSRARTARYLGALFAFSTLMQLISRSSDERWNAISTSLISASLLFFGRKDRQISNG